MQEASALRRTEPYLLQFATERSSEGSAMDGGYCERRQLWVVDVDGAPQPIVEAAPTMLAQTHTKTMTQVEADDHDQDRGAMADTSTLTRVRQEADDQDHSLCTMGGTSTLTEVKQEADDRDPSMGLTEIQTKTSVQQETDDEVTNLI